MACPARRRARPPVRGVATVELAMLLVPLVLMVFGTTELGRAIYTYDTLAKTTRDAARHLSQHGPGDAAVAAEARCLAATGTTDCSAAPVAPGLITAMVTLCDAKLCPSTHASQLTGLGSVNLVTAGIAGYPFASVVTLVVPSLGFNTVSVTLRAQL